MHAPVLFSCRSAAQVSIEPTALGEVHSRCQRHRDIRGSRSFEHRGSRAGGPAEASHGRGTEGMIGKAREARWYRQLSTIREGNV